MRVAPEMKTMRIKLTHEQYHRVHAKLAQRRMLNIIQNTENGFSSVSGAYVVIVIKAEFVEVIKRFATRLENQRKLK